MTTLKINHPAFRNTNVFNRTPFTGLFDEFFGNTSLATIDLFHNSHSIFNNKTYSC